MRRGVLYAVLLATVAGIMFAPNASAATGIRFNSSSIGFGGRLTLNGTQICDILLVLTLTRNPMTKTTGVNQGTLGGTIQNCSGGGATGGGTVLAGITVQYQSFAGNLPSITSVVLNVPNAGFKFGTLAGDCLYGGNWTGLRLNATALTISGMDMNTTATLPKVSGIAFCPSMGTARGLLAALGTPPTITLV